MSYIEDGLYLKRVGTIGNIAINSLNGLTAASYSCIPNAWDAIYPPEAAFTGTRWGTPVATMGLADPVVPNLGLAWISQNNNPTNQWLQVDFGRKAKDIKGIGIYCNDAAGPLSAPKDITIQVSDDGASFTNHYSGTVANATQQANNYVPLYFPPVTTRYFRVLVVANHGNTGYVEIDELEVYQDNPLLHPSGHAVT